MGLDTHMVVAVCTETLFTAWISLFSEGCGGFWADEELCVSPPVIVHRRGLD